MKGSRGTVTELNCRDGTNACSDEQKADAVTDSDFGLRIIDRSTTCALP